MCGIHRSLPSQSQESFGIFILVDLEDVTDGLYRDESDVGNGVLQKHGRPCRGHYLGSCYEYRHHLGKYDIQVECLGHSLRALSQP